VATGAAAALGDAHQSRIDTRERLAAPARGGRREEADAWGGRTEIAARGDELAKRI
jgi:hypothetical protein